MTNWAYVVPVAMVFVIAWFLVRLPEAVLGDDVASREVEIVRVARVDVGDAPAVANHLHRLAPPGHLERAGDSSERVAGERFQIGCRRLRAHRGQRERHQRADDHAPMRSRMNADRRPI